MDEALVHRLRRDARERAAIRTRTPELPVVTDAATGGTTFRHYIHDAKSEPGWVAVFAHGGYFVFGDLDLQDRYCRRLARVIRGDVISVDYALAPEHRAAESIDDFLRCVGHARSTRPGARILLCGDSAGGAIAFTAAARLRDQDSPADALFMSNPNLDLTLASFDRDASGGPDPALLADAIKAWAGSDPVGSGFSPLHARLQGMPSTAIAVGALDALRPEAEEAARALSESGVRTRLRVFPGIGHGFMGGETPLESAAQEQASMALADLLSDGVA